VGTDDDRKVLKDKAAAMGYSACGGSKSEGMRFKCTAHVDCPSMLRLSMQYDVENNSTDVRPFSLFVQLDLSWLKRRLRCSLVQALPERCRAWREGKREPGRHSAPFREDCHGWD